MRHLRPIAALVLFLVFLPFEDGLFVTSEEQSYRIHLSPAPLLAPAGVAVVTDATSPEVWKRYGRKLRILWHALRGQQQALVIHKKSALAAIGEVHRSLPCSKDQFPVIDYSGLELRCGGLEEEQLFRRFSTFTPLSLSPLRYQQDMRGSRLRVGCQGASCQQEEFALMGPWQVVAQENCRLDLNWAPERWAGVLAQLPLPLLQQLNGCEGLSVAQRTILERTLAFRRRYF